MPALTATTSAPTNVRRSNRLAAKPHVSYKEPESEVPDEALMERTQTMFDTLLDEQLDIATRDFNGVIWKTCKLFVQMYSDLEKDDVERIAAEKVAASVTTHTNIQKYYDIVWQYLQKTLKSKAAVKAAKRSMRIKEDNEMLKVIECILVAHGRA